VSTLHVRRQVWLLKKVARATQTPKFRQAIYWHQLTGKSCVFVSGTADGKHISELGSLFLLRMEFSDFVGTLVQTFVGDFSPAAKELAIQFVLPRDVS